MAFTHFGTDLAIDLGTANTCVYAQGQGRHPERALAHRLQRRQRRGRGGRHRCPRDAGPQPEPSPARPADRRRRHRRLRRDGEDAARTSSARPTRVRAWFRPRVLVGVPIGITPVERRAVNRLGLPRQGERGLPGRRADGRGRRRRPADCRCGRQHDHRHRRRHRRHRRPFPRRRRDSTARCASPATRWTTRFIHLLATKRHDLLHRRADRTKRSSIAIGSATPLDAPLSMEVKGRHSEPRACR